MVTLSVVQMVFGEWALTNGDDTSFITNSQETISHRSVSWNGRKKTPKKNATK